jgi:UDP-2,3-diacylglucosamine hydrolase
MTTPRVDEIQALDAWHCIDFLSDVHLQAQDIATFEAWQRYLQQTPANAVFILGDLFEVWVGDDTPEPFAKQCLAQLDQLAQRANVYVMHGNRDFLLGTQHKYAFELIADPCVLDVSTTTHRHRLLLSHGDAWCLDDHAYQDFRRQVRSPAWQHAFLAKTWDERAAIGRALRDQSQAQHEKTQVYADVDLNSALDALRTHDCQTLIHGHTHRPAVHALDEQHTRWVLSDWHAQSQPPRLEIIRWQRALASSPTQGLERLAVLSA